MKERVTVKEKQQLLDSIEGEIEYSISFSVIRNLIIAITVTLVLLFPKIYISSHIYIKSVQINKLLNEYYSLKAEHSLLVSKIEKIKFKNQLQKLSF
ncbi:MAG: hypothetical protein ABGX26_08425 [Nautiliaceae bacterium]|jgi:hypothetical protein